MTDQPPAGPREATIEVVEQSVLSVVRRGDADADPVPLAAAKAAMRRRIRDARSRRDAAHRAHIAEALSRTVVELPELARARRVTLYADMPGEPGTSALREELRRRSIEVLLPIVLPEGRLDWAVDDGALTPARGPGGPEPTGPRLGEDAPLDADVLVVPALAVDTLGHRLGQGGGYYDRLLSRLSRRPVVALVHEDEVLDAAVEPVPVGPHDVRVEIVATPVRSLRLR